MNTNKKYIPFGGYDSKAENYSDAKVVVLPIYYENAISYGTGTSEAPYHFLNASWQLECIDEEILLDWRLPGIYTLEGLFPDNDPEKAIMQIKKAAEKVIKDEKFLLSIGGDHAISIGLIMGVQKHHPDIGVLQIDAHLDLRETYNGSKYNHACVMRRVVDDIKIPVVQVGIRSFSPEEASYVIQKQLFPIYAHKIDLVDQSWMKDVLKALPEKVYITIDLDGIDPSAMPGVGTPEPGGLSYKQVVDLIKKIGKRKKVIGADICELSKIEGTQVSEFTAAKIATKIFVHCL
jgi:agmatinase